MPQIEPYDIFSNFYDEFIKDSFPNLHDNYVSVVEKILREQNFKPQYILDASCGTGLLIDKLKTSLSLEVEGMDLNRNMLNKAKEKGFSVFHGDLRDFNLDKKYDLIICFDSLGHITSDYFLEKLFINVENHLNTDGLFMFDGGTKDKAENMANKTFTYSSDTYSFIWENKLLDSGTIEVNLDIWENSNKEKGYTETFILRGHDVDEIQIALEKCNLTSVFLTMEPLVKKGSFICCAKRADINSIKRRD